MKTEYLYPSMTISADLPDRPSSACSILNGVLDYLSENRSDTCGAFGRSDCHDPWLGGFSDQEEWMEEMINCSSLITDDDLEIGKFLEIGDYDEDSSPDPSALTLDPSSILTPESSPLTPEWESASEMETDLGTIGCFGNEAKQKVKDTLCGVKKPRKKPKQKYPANQKERQAKHHVLEDGAIQILEPRTKQWLEVPGIFIAQIASEEMKALRGRQGKPSDIDLYSREMWPKIEERHLKNWVTKECFRQILRDFLSFPDWLQDLLMQFFSQIFRVVFLDNYVRIMISLESAAVGINFEDYELANGVNGRLDFTFGKHKSWISKKSVKKSVGNFIEESKKRIEEEDRMEAREMGGSMQLDTDQVVPKRPRGPATKYRTTADLLLKEFSPDERRHAEYEVMKNHLTHFWKMDYPALSPREQEFVRHRFEPALETLGLLRSDPALDESTAAPTGSILAQDRKIYRKNRKNARPSSRPGGARPVKI